MMDWANERYVRMYTRDTPTWVSLSWQARGLFSLILRACDRAGVIELGRTGLAGIALVVHAPWEEIRERVEELVADGCIEIHGNDRKTVVVPNFIEAQESLSSPASRQRDSRERRRDLIRRGMHPGLKTAVVYFVQSEHGGPVKIGHAEDVARRLVQLQTSRPDKLLLLTAAPSTIEDERRVHAHFADVREKGEWFSPHSSLMSLVSHVAKHGEIPRDLSQFVTGHPLPSVPCLTKQEERDVELHSTPPVLDLRHADPGSEPPPKPRASAAVRQVFEHWQTVMGHPRAKLDRKRERVIAAAIKSHDVDTCLAAIDGCAKTPFNMGENRTRERYDDICLILRDAPHIERFAETAAGRELPSLERNWTPEEEADARERERDEAFARQSERMREMGAVAHG